MVNPFLLALSLLAADANGAGFAMESGWTSFSGPDNYATLRLRMDASPDIEVGVLGVAGTEPAWFGTAARTFRLHPRFYAKGELDLGMAREAGPVFGLGGALRLDADPLDIVTSARWTDALGFQGDIGVDAPLSDRWTLGPRLRAETWAGERDPALRAVLGARYQAPSRWFVGLEASAGGRDVLHMGPGITLCVGRKP